MIAVADGSCILERLYSIIANPLVKLHVVRLEAFFYVPLLEAWLLQPATRVVDPFLNKDSYVNPFDTDCIEIN